jgi:lysophospholipase L1-like esterase
MQAFSIVCYTVGMTSVRRLAGLAAIGAAGLALTRSSAPPEAAGSGAPLTSDAARRGELAAEAPGVPEAAVVDTADSRAPVYSSAILRWRAHAQERILGHDQGTEDAWGHIVPARRVALDEGQEPPPVNGNALGSFVPVENEAALNHFHAALDQLSAHPEQKNKVRIVAYGASHTQADIYSSYLRYYLQERFGNGGPGFLPLGMERGWSQHDFAVRSHGLQVEYVQSKGPPPHGRFGLSGSAALAKPSAWARVEPRDGNDPELAASQYGLFYAAEPEGAELSVSLDGGEPVLLPTRANEVAPRSKFFERPLGWHAFEVRALGSSPSRLFGVSIERRQPGLVIDTLGIRGTRAATMLFWDQALWEEPLRQRAPDLVILAYGTNETTDQNQPIEEYASSLERVLARVRQALPEASCVLVGPGDFPKAQADGWVTRPRLLEIIAEQRRLAPRFRCGFWDAYSFMGGAGSMAEWARSNPRLGATDHIHLTPRGYVRMGLSLGDALMRAYDARHVPLDARVTIPRSSEAAEVGASAAVGSAAIGSPAP